jgi:hypothetical protein
MVRAVASGFEYRRINFGKRRTKVYGQFWIDHYKSLCNAHVRFFKNALAYFVSGTHPNGRKSGSLECCRKSLFASLNTNFPSRRCGGPTIVWGLAEVPAAKRIPATRSWLQLLLLRTNRHQTVYSERSTGRRAYSHVPGPCFEWTGAAAPDVSGLGEEYERHESNDLSRVAGFE